MLEKLKELINFPGTPVIMFVAMLIVDGILHNLQAFTLSFAICLVMFVIMVLSAVVNFSYYGKFMKYTCVILCALTALFLYTEMPFGETVGDAEAPKQHNAGTNYSHYDYGSYNGYYDYYDYSNQDDSFTMECNRCHGSGKCEDCGGSGRSKLKGVLAAGGCALCDASGRCYKCNGKGYTVH